MKAWRTFWARAVELVRWRRVERELDDEVSHHLELMTDEYVRRGLSRADAAAAARRAFGGVDQTKEAVRDRRGFRWIDHLGRDVHYAIRLLAKSRGFTVTAVLTLALGIGVNTAIFSLVDGVLLRHLPYPDADRLVSMWEVSRRRPGDGSPPSRLVFAPADLADAARAQSINVLAAYSGGGKTLTGSGAPERVLGEEITANYFIALGAQPALGRLIQPDDNRIGADRVVVLSDDLWRVRFGADTGIVGKTITLDDERYRVIGVTRPEFRAITSFRQADAGRFWVPITFDAELLANRDDHEVDVVAKLAPGVSVTAAREELARIADGILATLPPTSGSHIAMAPIEEDIARNVSPMFVLLLGAVALILLIACVNVANLLIVRALSRQREVAVRLALGASRARVMRELVTHSLVLTTLGGLAGLGLAALTKSWIIAYAPASIPRLDNVSLDWRVLAFTAGTSAIVGLVFGLLPLRHVTRARPSDALRSGDRVIAHSWVQRWRSLFMVVELATSLALLIGAGLMARSLIAVNRVDLGFNPDGVLAANVTLPDSRYTTQAARFQFYDQLASRVAAMPGVESVAFGNRLPLRGSWQSGFGLDPADGSSKPGPLSAGFQAVSVDYFTTFGIRLRAGRLFSTADRDGVDGVAVVNEHFSRVFLGGAPPIGKRLRRGERQPWMTIVGVVANIHRDGKTEPENPEVYLPAAQTSLYPLRLGDLAVRTAGDPLALRSQVLAAVWAIDPNQTVTNVRTLDQVLSLRLAERHFQTFLFGLFATLAMALALVGVHGVVSYAVLQRRPEIGIRLALGADPGRILSWLLGQTARLVAIGVVLGLGLAWTLSSAIAGLLFTVTPTDGITYAAAATILAFVAMATSALAARSAARVDPTSALRTE